MDLARSRPSAAATFFAPNAVVESVFVGRVGLVSEVGGLCENDVAGESAFEAWCVDCLGFDGAAEAVIESRDRCELGGSQKFQVLDEFEGVAVEVADTRTTPECCVLNEALVDMCQWEVRDNNVVLAWSGGNEAGRCCGDSVGVGETDSFRIACRTRCIIDRYEVGRFGRVARTVQRGAECLDCLHGVDLDVEISRDRGQQCLLGVVWVFIMGWLETVEDDNDLETG